MSKGLKIGLLSLVVIGAVVVTGGMLAYLSTQPNSSPVSLVTGSSKKTNPAANVISLDQLAQKNGVNGNDCYVAIDTRVYLVKGVASWEMGRHTPADSSVTCGKNLTQALQESPHGAKVLRKLPVVGTLQN